MDVYAVLILLVIGLVLIVVSGSEGSAATRSFVTVRGVLFMALSAGCVCYNETLRRSERRRVFNVSEFKRIAAASINQKAEDVTHFEKLTEGPFNRTFLITMRDGFQFVGRVPYPVLQPKYLAVASEVATMDFLRLHGIPIPKVYAYSATSENAAGTEYILMKLVRGMSLSDIWLDMSEKALETIIRKLVQLEARLFALEFPASGSLYCTKDLQAGSNKIDILTAGSTSESRFCIGPDTMNRLWCGKRLGLQVFRGPYTDPAALMKEIAYLAKYGRPLHPLQRLHGETHKYQKQSHLEHLDNLNKYLQIVPHLIPDDETLTQPTIRSPDLNFNNIFVSDDLDITGLIDWQHSTILPLFLARGIPDRLQNHADPDFDPFDIPELPPDFSELSAQERLDQILLLRQRQSLHFNAISNEKLNPANYIAMSHAMGARIDNLFHSASAPWEGDAVTLKANLIHVTKKWAKLAKANANPTAKADVSVPPCLISFSEDEAEACLNVCSALDEADRLFEECREVVGVGAEGWVSHDWYEEAKLCEEKLRVGAVEAAESEEERTKVSEHWVFGDFDEEEYF